MKTAAASALLAWTLLLTVAPLWMFATCDAGHLRGLWGQFQLVYSPFSQWAIPILLVAAVILVTWGLLVSGFGSATAADPDSSTPLPRSAPQA